MKKLEFRRIKALIKKEFHQIVRDPSTILIAFIFPLMLLTIYGVGVSLDMNNLKVGVVLEDTSQTAESFYYSLKGSKYFSIEVARHKYEIEKKVVAGKLRGLVTIPFYFTEFTKRPDKFGPIYVVADGSETNTANFVQNYVASTWELWKLNETLTAGIVNYPSINIQQRIWYNEELNSRHFLLPGSIAIIMTLIGTLLTALVIAREWERGTIESLMATPISMKDIYISKLISYFILGISSLILCTLISSWIFGVPFRGSILLLIFVGSIFLLTALGTGLIISIFTKNQFQASQISLLTAFLPAFMLSGFVFEINSMPILIRSLTYLIPAKYMVSSLLSLFLVGNVWRLLLINSAIMGFIALLLFILIFTQTRKRLD